MPSSLPSPGRPGTLVRHRVGLGAAVVLVALAVAVTIGIGALRTRATPVQAVRVTASATPATPATPHSVFVHVSGAVRAPGLYELPAGARLVDAVAAAGGFAADAVRDGVNLARPISDGEQVRVPVPGEQQPPAGVTDHAGGEAGVTPVNLNTADEQALDALPRIGPALAGRIVQWRVKNGPFTSVDDLLAVSGIGPKMLETLRDLVTV